MADSPGKVLSSFASSNEKKGNDFKLGGCAGVFFQLLDRFHGKKFFPHKLLPSERPKYNIISHREEKLPMAKLLLIADEKRIEASKETLSDGVSQRDEGHEEGQKKVPVSVVARLMGLETMPAPRPVIERKQIEISNESSEAQSRMKLLDCKRVPVKRTQRNTKAMDIKIQTLKGTAKSFHRGHPQSLNENGPVDDDALKHSSARSKLNRRSRSCVTVTQINSRKGEDSRAFIFFKLPLPTIQMESQLKSVLSPSRTSGKLLSPIKSPLPSLSAARLIGAAARVLEPNLRPARHLGFSSHNVKSAPRGSAGDDNKKQSTTLLGPKGTARATSRCSNSSPEKSKELSRNFATQNRPFHSKDGARKSLSHVKQEKLLNNISTMKKQSLVSNTSNLEVNDPTNSECRLITSSIGNKNIFKCVQIDNNQESVPALVVGEESRIEGSVGLQGPHTLSPPGTRSAKRSNHGTISKPSRTERPPQCPYHSSGKTSQKGSRNNAKDRFTNEHKASSLAKTDNPNAHGRTNLEEVKRESSCRRSSSKRKASSLSAKPSLLSNVARAEARNFKLQNVELKRNMQRLAKETQNTFSKSSHDSSAVCCFDDRNMASSMEAESRGQTRVRARWDIADERKRNLTMSCISCSNSNDLVSSCSSVNSTLRADDALEPVEAAVDVLQELLLPLDASTSRPLSPELGTPEHKSSLFSDGLEALYDCSAKSDVLTGLLNECSSNIESHLGGAKQSRCYECYSTQEDSSAQDSESISGSFCTEECEQPSPVSILESPFHDSASSSSDNFEAPQGIKFWEAMENGTVDNASTMPNHMADVKSHGIDNKSFTHFSQFHSINSGRPEIDAKSNTIREHEDRYVKKILGTAYFSTDLAVWERLAFSGPLIDPLIYYQLEENLLLTRRAGMPTAFCKESDHERRVPTSFTTWCKEAAPQQRKLLFDCIEAALNLNLELGMWSYGNLVPRMQFPPAYLEAAVCRHLAEWKGLAFSMNLDDMMKVEINAGMGRWFKYGDEVENVATSVEAMIFNGLIDEFLEDVLQKVQACCHCR